jgi:hypothetical protein
MSHTLHLYSYHCLKQAAVIISSKRKDSHTEIQLEIPMADKLGTLVIGERMVLK